MAQINDDWQGRDRLVEQVSRLSEQVEAMRAELDRLRRPSPGASEEDRTSEERLPTDADGPAFSRRQMLGRTVGLAAAGFGAAAVGSLVSADPGAAATGGNFILGVTNSATTQTVLESNNPFPVLAVFPTVNTNLSSVLYGSTGGSGPGVQGDDISPGTAPFGTGPGVFGSTGHSTSPGVWGAASAGGQGVLGTSTGIGAAVEADQHGTGHGVFANITNPNNVSGVAVFGQISTTTSALEAMYGLNKGLGNGVVGEVQNASNSDSAVMGVTNGTGFGVAGLISAGTATGVTGQITNATNPQPAMYGYTAGTGDAVFGQIVNASSPGNAVHGWTVGPGTGVLGENSSFNGMAIYGFSTSASNTQPTVYGTGAGSGPGVQGDDFSPMTSGHGTGPGVLGSVFNVSSSSPGVYGTSLGSGPGVAGRSLNTDPAVRGIGVSGAGAIGVSASGSLAPLQLAPGSTAGPPTANAHQQGEVYIDSNGVHWHCTSAGSPGTWVQAITGGVNNVGNVATQIVSSNQAFEAVNTGPAFVAVRGHVTNPSNPNTAMFGITEGTGNALYGKVNNASSSAVALRGDNAGTGPGVMGYIANNSSHGYALWGETAGLGQAVYGQIDNSSNAAAAVEGITHGTGRGGKFTGVAAAVQLVPATGSHPSSGLAGDLFVDSSNSLWFCKGGTTWVQVA